MIRRVRFPLAVFPAVLLGLAATAGCSGHKPCEGSKSYRDSAPGPGLQVPSGLDAPEDNGLMNVPGGAVSADALDKCMESPPNYYARAGEPNAEGLPVSAVVGSSVAVAEASGRAPDTREMIPGASVLTNDVAAFVTNWAALWTARDADDWLGMYRDDFVQPGFQSHADWVATQRDRFQTPASTEVPLDTLQVEPLAGDRARAEFVQRFGSAPTFRSVKKELVLERQQNRWVIAQERILDVL